MALPNGAKRLTYIQSSGTQYIDTGFKPNQDTRLVFDFMLLASSVAYLYGVRGNSDESYNNRFGVIYTSGYRADYNTGNGTTFSGLSVNTRYTFDQNKNTCTVGEETLTYTAATFQSPYTALLFGVNEGGVASYLSTGRLYSCQIYDNGTLVRDFIPCLLSSGEIGLWDDVNSVFYGDAAAVGFAAGPKIYGTDVWSQIERLQDNTKNALAAIAAWGVDVPDATTSDDLAELIEEIILVKQATVGTGTFATPSNRPGSVNVTVGFKPTYVFVYTFYATHGNGYYLLWRCTRTGKVQSIVQNGSEVYYSGSAAGISITSSGFSVNFASEDSGGLDNIAMYDGHVYYYVVIGG